MPDMSKVPKRLHERLNKLRNVVEDRYNHSRRAYNGLRDDFDRFMELYLAQNDETGYPWESNLVAPAVFDAVETHLPHIITEDLEFRVVPRAGADPAAATIWDNLLKYDVEKTELPWQMVPFAKQGMILGTSAMFAGYMYEEEVLSVREFESILVGTQAETLIPTTNDRKVVTFDGPWIEPVDMLNLFPEPGKRYVNAPGGRGMAWLIHRYRVPMYWMEELDRRGILIPGTLDAIKKSHEPTHTREFSAEQDRAELLGLDLDPLADESVQYVEILAMWGDRMAEQRGLVWLANRDIICRDEGHPFFHGKIPFEFFQDIPMFHDIMGIGEAHILENYQHEKSDLKNARLDNVHQSLNRMWTVIQDAGIDPNELQSRPGGVIHVDRHDNIQPLDHNDLPASAYRDDDRLQDDIDRTTGALDVLRGSRLGGNRSSATENQLLAELASTRSLIKRMGLRRCLRNIGRMMVSIEQQFTTEEKILHIQGPDGQTVEVPVAPEDIAGNWDVTVELDQRLPLTRIQRRTEAAELWDRLAPLFGTFIDPMPFAEELLSAYGRDARRLIQPIQQGPPQQGGEPAPGGAEGGEAVDTEQVAMRALEQALSGGGGG